jgi:hypothetical protein
MNCTVETRQDLRQARRALLAHREIVGAALHSPREGELDEWSIELALVGRWSLEHHVTADEHGLAVEEVVDRSPSEKYVLLAR